MYLYLLHRVAKSSLFEVDGFLVPGPINVRGAASSMNLGRQDLMHVGVMVGFDNRFFLE